MAIKQAITEYLNAVERAHGSASRQRTSVEHREGTSLVIKRGEKPAQVIELGTLYSLTRMLEATA
ncbi:MAG: hypothetical protein R8K53_06820 [Mariprofundaceae bacterium]